LNKHRECSGKSPDKCKERFYGKEWEVCGSAVASVTEKILRGKMTYEMKANLHRNSEHESKGSKHTAKNAMKISILYDGKTNVVITKEGVGLPDYLINQ